MCRPCLQSCQGFNRRSILFIFRGTEKGTRSILLLASCGNDISRVGTRGTGMRPRVFLYVASLLIRGDHSCIRNATSNDATDLARTLYKSIKGAQYGESRSRETIRCRNSPALCALVTVPRQ